MNRLQDGERIRPGRLGGLLLGALLLAAAPAWAEPAEPGGIDSRARAGDPEAQLALGYAHALGEGVIQDFVEAHKWLNLAAAAGEPRAAEARDRLAERMTPGQIARAQEAAREWVAEPAPAERAPRTDEAPAAAPREPAFAGPEVASRATVARIQRGLAFVGYPPGPVDGLVGDRTRAAARAFQRDRGLPVDGRITGELLEELRLAASEGFQAPPQAPAAADPQEALRVLIDELLSLTAEAEERRAADPRFLDDLRALARRYEGADGGRP
jgi:hypothetical protein